MFINKNFDSREFEVLFTRWNRKVYHYALSKTSDSYIAEETVQRVFIKLWNNLSKKNIDCAIESQIFTITRTVLLDIVKEEYRRKQAIDQIPMFMEDAQVSIPIEIKETESALQQIIGKMPPMRKLVFQLSRFEQLNYQEIAEKLKISPRTVENHISLALKMIRKSFSNFLFLLLALLSSLFL